MKTLTSFTDVPIYQAKVWLFVAGDIEKKRKSLDNLLGPYRGGDCDGLCSWGLGSTFWLFFKPDRLSHRLVSHELFHLTHRILDWASANFDSSHHEPAALLCGHLTHWTYSELRRGKFQISNT